MYEYFTIVKMAANWLSHVLARTRLIRADKNLGEEIILTLLGIHTYQDDNYRAEEVCHLFWSCAGA